MPAITCAPKEKRAVSSYGMSEVDAEVSCVRILRIVQRAVRVVIRVGELQSVDSIVYVVH